MEITRRTFQSELKRHAPTVIGISTSKTSARDASDRRRRRLTLIATSLGFAVVQLDVSVVNVALRAIATGLHAGVSDLQWIVAAYTVSFAALILGAGALGDRLGARRVFAAGFVIFTAASAGCGLSPDLPMLIAFRALQGVGAAVLVPCSLALLHHAYPEARDRARAVGIWAAGASAALSGGPLVGGILTAAIGWRAIFFINLPIGLLGVAMTLRFAAQTPRSGGRGVDAGGQVLAIVTLTALAAATIEGGTHGFTAPAVLGGFLVALLAGMGFVVVEHRRAEPMLPLELFGAPAFGAATAIGLLINVGFYGLVFALSLYFASAQGFSPLLTGLAFAPMTGVVMVGNVLAGRLAAHAGVRAVMGAGALLFAAGAAGLLGAAGKSPYLVLLAPLLAIGLGLGLIVPLMTAVLLSGVPGERAGVAAGTLNTARQTGSVIGVSLFGSLIAGHLVAGLHVAALVCVGLALGVAVVVRWAREASV